MTRRKKGFLLWCSSLLPGAGEMYMGFFKHGISTMLLFFAIIAISGYLNLGAIIFLLPVLWFYGFFHVHCLASLSDEEFYAVEDTYIFNFENKSTLDFFQQEKGKKVLAVSLIVVGGFALWNKILQLLYPILEPYLILREVHKILLNVPEILFAVLLIWIGAIMIKGKKKEFLAIEEEEK